MRTPFDFISVTLFAALAVLFLHRSSREEDDRTPFWVYGLAAVGCAVADLLGNSGHVILSTLIMTGVAAYLAHLAIRTLRD